VGHHGEALVQLVDRRQPVEEVAAQRAGVTGGVDRRPPQGGRHVDDGPLVGRTAAGDTGDDGAFGGGFGRVGRQQGDHPLADLFGRHAAHPMIRPGRTTGPPQPFGPSARVVAVTAEPPEPRPETTTEPPEPRPATSADQPVSSFDELYTAHFAALTVPLFAYLGDRQQAQDVVQEAFCRALARWRGVSGSGDPVGWIRRTAWRLAVDRPRFLRRRRSPHALITALGTLPPAHRRALVLRHLGELTTAEIADQEGVAEATVEFWLHHARTALTGTTAPEVRRD
jgi:RNA polymerase sigma-70 factor (ECF subfamily)